MGYKDSIALPGGAATNLGASIVPIAGTNILVLRGADPQALLTGSAINTKNEIYAHTKSAVVDKCIHGICKDSVAVVSDCKKAKVFKVSSDPSVAADKLTLKHTEDWGGGDKANDNFDKLSEVAPMKTVVYFVAEGKGADKGPSLYQKINKEDAVELVEDVEDISFTYGVAGTTYKKAENMLAAEWAQVTAIRVELLVRSDMDNVVENKQPYTFDSTPVAQAAVPDKRIRKVFTATVGVRSRT
jgi:type IV pilus assembly protein PilW